MVEKKSSLVKWVSSKEFVSTVILLLWVVIALLPIVFIFVTSIKTDEEVYLPYITWIPQKPTIKPYIYALFGESPFSQYIMNSIIVAGTTTAIVIILASISSYAFSRFKFKGGQAGMFAVLASRLLPPVSLLIPWFIVASSLQLIDTLQALILTNIYMNLPFAIWLLKGFYDAIPRDFDDAALVDGCSTFQAFRKIILPLIGPGIGAVAVLTFLFSWNELLFAITLSMTPASRVVSAGVYDFVTDAFIEWPKLCAAAMLAVIPAMIFVIFFQKYLVRGLVAGALKR